MSFDFNEYAKEHPEFNIIPEKQVSIIKIKLAKTHRTEADWKIIKDILNAHDLIICKPSEPDDRLKTVKGILAEKGALIAFTNSEDSKQYLFTQNIIDSKLDRAYIFGAVSFLDLVDIAENLNMDIYIDPQDENDKVYMMYIHGEHRIMAVKTQNNWNALHNFLRKNFQF